jgi:hypothetical protein
MTGIFCISVLMCSLLKRFRRFLALPLCWTAGILTLHGQAVPKAEKILSERGELVISLKKPAGLSLDSLTMLMSIDRIDHDTITAYINKMQYERLIRSGIPFSVKSSPVAFKTQTRSSGWQARYPSYSEYAALMHNFASAHFPLATLDDIGTTPGGHSLYFLHIVRPEYTYKQKPRVVLSSSIHGDELVGYYLMLRLIDLLLTGYDKDPAIRTLVDSTDLYINPLANPDGTFHGSDTSVSEATRFNLNGIDLNRNFPDPVKGNHPDSREWQNETILMMNFLNFVRPELSVNFHGGAELVNYPWDALKEVHADDEWFRWISRAYADSVHAHAQPGYMTDEENGISNGYAWYTVYGGRQDYVTWFLRGREVTIELSTNKIPDENQLESFWKSNYRSLLQYIDKVHTGFRGTVTDSVTGKPLPAMISLSGHDYNHSEVYADSSNSVFFRMIQRGNYQVDFSCPGYDAKHLNIEVLPDQLTFVHVKLKPVEQISFYPNPFSDLLRIYISETGNNLVLDFTDITGRKVKKIVQHVNAPGWQEIRTTGLDAGNYILHLQYGDLSSGSKVIKIR